MIPFFRRIRRKSAFDDKPLKYMRYAIGEIVLVVIGILIALQINNWNQDRLQQNQEIHLLNTLLKDLKQAENKSIELINKEETIFKSFNFFLSGKPAQNKLLNNPKIDSIFSRLIWGSVSKEVPVINSYTDLKNAGETGLISNENVRVHLSSLENSISVLTEILDDRMSVQLINIDGLIIHNMNFLQLLKFDPRLKVDYGQKNDYAELFQNQVILNVIAIKLDLTDSVIRDRNLLLIEIQELIQLIETELLDKKKS